MNWFSHAPFRKPAPAPAPTAASVRSSLARQLEFQGQILLTREQAEFVIELLEKRNEQST